MNIHSQTEEPMTAAPPLHLTHAQSMDQRSAEILEGVRRAFAEKGFDGASMQDLARSCGMSVGNFYRYFPSKAAIVAALILRDLAEMEATFREILRSPDPLSGLRATINARIMQGDCEGEGQLWAEITAAALRKAEISAITTHMEHEIIGYLTSIFAKAKNLTEADARERYYPQAMLLVMLVKASAMHPAENPRAQQRLTDLLLHTVARTIDDVANDDLKG
ncbi:TetR/AcrR family transcriptional regulator [Paragemmobacter straminiformis]|uniref:TetR/AcrR family transcriptional regulator n=1 Tax=Paragemmobacter straminiformis TaxID=2045119 RepID=A0A842I8P6_9RHOB|nr:TetR/AcrR family transcriptional regulator [Gemmobacter straminiformis]MBC2835986.1 TetR/AcrR family transcriptional regulator [Gemmobacter straminiformis]